MFVCVYNVKQIGYMRSASEEEVAKMAGNVEVVGGDVENGYGHRVQPFATPK